MSFAHRVCDSIPTQSLDPADVGSNEAVLERALVANRSFLTEFDGEPDYVHLLVDLHPDNNISNLVFSLKSASSRVLSQQFREQINRVYWGKDRLWHDSKCIVSCGGAPLEIVKQYIQSQSGGAIHPDPLHGGEFRTFS